MGDVRARIRVYDRHTSERAQTIVTDPTTRLSADVHAAKEWSVVDDMLNIADNMSAGIANDRGQVAGQFFVGQRVEFEESDPDVAGGAWVRHFTGLITAIESYSDIQGGSNIRLDAYDLGWFLNSCDAEPLKNIKHILFQRLLNLLIDPTWGFGVTQASNDLNRRLKHGRQIVIQNHKPVLGAILPFIQVEPGQKPIDLLRTYAAREGVLLNVSARGEIVLFRPRYDQQALYEAIYHGDGDGQRNTVIGRPSLRQTIDGIYSEVQCWSTVVIPPEIANSENPNEAYRHTTYRPGVNPLPFFRRHVFSDGEAINERLRRNRAIWKFQMDAFNSTQYECEFSGHSQRGAFFVSDTLIDVDDTINAVSGAMYVQRAARSMSLSGGTRAKLLCRLPGLLNPELTTLSLGGGARKTKAGRKKAA